MVHMIVAMTSRQAAAQRFAASPKGRAGARRYRRSDKGKAAAHRAYIKRRDRERAMRALAGLDKRRPEYHVDNDGTVTEI